MPPDGRAVDDPTPWWRSAVVYQVYPRSFADSNGDGIGDLEGIRRRLPYLSWLGVDAVWISPFYRSPMRDGGYDISDHCAVDPLFGTMADAERLVQDAHDLGLRVLIDWVPNHTSDEHDWFRASRSSREDPKRDWYIWRDTTNNWRAALGAGSAWTFDEATAQYYLHLFLPEQPDLNWRTPAVVTAMHDTLRFWLDRGVDGFRIDVAHCIGKDPTFADDPRCDRGRPLADFNDQPASHDALRGVRRVTDDYSDRVLVGEVNIRSTEAIHRYYGNGDELHLVFNFRLLDAPWSIPAIGPIIDEVAAQFGDVAHWPTWVLSNHDNRRHRTRYGGSEARARAAAVLLLTLRGTPFVFQGEELGLEDARIAPDRRVDPGGRDGCRAPIPWEATAPHGWEGDEPWLPFASEPAARSVESERADPESVLHLYRRLLALRRRARALQVGTWERLPAPPDVLAYRRALEADSSDHAPDDAYVVVVSAAEEPRTIELEHPMTVCVASDGVGEGEPFTGRLGVDQAVVLR